MQKLTLLAILLCGQAHAALTVDEVTEAYNKTVKTSVQVPPEVVKSYLARAQAALGEAKVDVEREQFVLAVDRNPMVQTAFLFVGSSATGFAFVGASPVSTGSRGRFDHYITPVGVYDHKLTDYSDFRAEGTKNSNGIRGYGAKGMRIWDFGWVPAKKGWGKRDEQGDIRFQMHATDPSVLERRLGRPDSKGCVRVASGLNAFLDKYGVLDWHYEQSVAHGGNRPWVWQKGRIETQYSGRYLVVVDSGATARPEWRDSN